MAEKKDIPDELIDALVANYEKPGLSALLYITPDMPSTPPCPFAPWPATMT